MDSRLAQPGATRRHRRLRLCRLSLSLSRSSQNTGATWQASSGSFLWGQTFETEVCLLQPADASEINNLYDIGGADWKDVSVGVDFTLNSLKESMAIQMTTRKDQRIPQIDKNRCRW